jgi:structural maintenance of chromosome 2
VETEQIGKKLLEKGELKRRVTIIPLNKISGNVISGDVVKQAESLVGKENVQTALSLVGYENQLKSAMEFVFGTCFVCSDMDAAKKVTFDDRVLKKSVTLDGDSFDPAGTLTGGARIQSNSVLLSLMELNNTNDALLATHQKLDQVDKELTTIRGQVAKWRELKQLLDLKSREAQLLSDRLKQSSHGQQLDEINKLEMTIADQEEMLKKSAETKKKAASRIAELEDKLKNSGAVREREMKQAEQEVDHAKKKYEQSNKKMKDKEKDVQQLQLELQDIEKEIRSSEEQIATLKNKIANENKQLEQLTAISDSFESELKKAHDQLTAQKDLLKDCSREINEAQAEISRLSKDYSNADLQLQELEHKVSKCCRDTKDAAKQVEQMLLDHAWILEEKKYFGHPNTAYDFKTNDPKEAGRRIQKLQETKDKLSKSVNMRAMNMLGKAEEQYNDLMKKRKIVLSDKAKIASVIAELDEKKNEALKKAYHQVDKDFGSIFSTLLPGAKARLVAPENMSILDGLEFKVAFGDVWKESLSELSGGQRSLVALSLILSLLLFKPAPLYILDEVDAALDLSHTQNIGQMLKTHFRHSQFIVVSLKDGMFNNANVLFKTKFVDGVSTVTRHVQRH